MDPPAAAPVGTERRELSQVVRDMHDRLAMKARDEEGRSEDENVNPETRWRRIWGDVPLTDAKAYASSMSALFERCWETTDYAVSLIASYFRAAPKCLRQKKKGDKRPRSDMDSFVSSAASNESEKAKGDEQWMSVAVCGRGARTLKERRRQFFDEHKRIMSPEELAVCAAEVNDAFEVRDRPLLVLDVGSCHGGLLQTAPEWMKVWCMDLCPANDRVLVADWLSVPLLSEEELPAGGKSVLTDAHQVTGILESSVDVVVMCYMLSFLPEGSMRWAAVIRAARVLRLGGVLIVMEPRRGAHKKRWHEQWVSTVHGSPSVVPLKVVRKEVLEHTVMIMFEKSANFAVTPEKSLTGVDAHSLDF